MTAFVKECRREWERLGVPDLLADEMATELESDLAEAEADGVSAAEMLGESDPRRFAATWASERGLVPEPAPQKRRRRVWPWVVGFVVFFVLLLTWLALQTLGSSGSSAPPTRVQVTPTPLPRVVVPNLVGEPKRAALASARAAGLAPEVHIGSHAGSAARVVRQQPAPGSRLRRGSTIRLFVARG